jgi:hypothetical protein
MLDNAWIFQFQEQFFDGFDLDGLAGLQVVGEFFPQGRVDGRNGFVQTVGAFV